MKVVCFDYSISININSSLSMADTFNPDDFKNGASFFGFLGVSMALVLASINIVMKIWVLPMVQLKRVQASVASPFGSHQW